MPNYHKTESKQGYYDYDMSTCNRVYQLMEDS